jgi:chemotaxis protein histidine kinase CheA
MGKQKPIEIINPPNALKAKIGGALPAVDERAIARAEAALAQLSGHFEDWMEEELSHLLAAWSAYDAQGGADAALHELHRRSHDLKGLAGTYGYPLVGRICGSLCKLTGEDLPADAPRAPASLLKAHVDAVRAIVASRIKAADHPVGLELAAELEERMRRTLGPQT